MFYTEVASTPLNNTNNWTELPSLSLTLPVGKYVITSSIPFGGNSGAFTIRYNFNGNIRASVYIPPNTNAVLNASATAIVEFKAEYTVKLIYWITAASTVKDNIKSMNAIRFS